MSIKNTTARLISIQSIYFFEVSDVVFENQIENVSDTIKHIIKQDEHIFKKTNKKFATDLIKKTCLHREKIDAIITGYLNKYDSISRLSGVLRSILRCAVGELSYCDTPYKVVIDEYTKLTKDFFSINEVNFINAILDKIAKDIKGEVNK
jgi:transcription antitermination protein NusB